MAARSNSDAGLIMDGVRAFHAAQPRTTPASMLSARDAECWQQGWDAAALEAGKLLHANRTLIASSGQVRDALREASAAIRALRPAKATPGQSRLAEQAQALITKALDALPPPASHEAAPAKGQAGARAPA